MSNEQVEGALAEVTDRTAKSFQVHDAATANWVVRKIIEARQYAARVKAWAELELRRAQRQEQFFMLRYERQLQDWVRQQIDTQHDGRRSVNLPSGTIGFRTEPKKLAVTDEKQLLAWCRGQLPSAIKVVESVPKTPLMDHLKTTGELPQGVELLGGNERFYVSGKILDFVEGEQDAAAE